MNLEEATRSLSALARLDPAARRLIRARGALRRYSPGDVLWHTGEAPRGLFFLVAGRVRVVRVRDGKSYLIHVADRPGETVGEVPLFTGRGYPATAVAATPTTCVVMPKGDLPAVMAADPRFATRLLEELGGRVHTLVQRLHDVTFGTVRSRLVERLRSGAELVDGRLLFRFASQERLAEDLGTVREVVTREIARLRAEGIVESRGRGCLEIVDDAGLGHRREGDAGEV